MGDDMHDRPAGWYRDPTRPNRHRYWDGSRWTGPHGETLSFSTHVLEDASAPRTTPLASGGSAGSWTPVGNTSGLPEQRRIAQEIAQKIAQ